MKDTSSQIIYEQSYIGTGAQYKWEGGQNGNSGSITIAKSDSTSGVWYQISMNDESRIRNGSVTYAPSKDSTIVKMHLDWQVEENLFKKYRLIMNKPFIEQKCFKSLEALKTSIETDSITVND
jgi:hypothetical protein